MKTLTTLTAVAALIAGITVAGAQTATPGTDAKTSNPSSMNAAPPNEGTAARSGSQMKATKDMNAKDTKMKGSATTGSGASSSVNPNEKSATDNGKLKAKDLNH